MRIVSYYKRKTLIFHFFIIWANANASYRNEVERLHIVKWNGKCFIRQGVNEAPLMRYEAKPWRACPVSGKKMVGATGLLCAFVSQNARVHFIVEPPYGTVRFFINKKCCWKQQNPVAFAGPTTAQPLSLSISGIAWKRKANHYRIEVRGSWRCHE